MLRYFVSLSLVMAGSVGSLGTPRQLTASKPGDPKASLAYGVLIVRKAAVVAELQTMLSTYKSGHPAVKNKQYELGLLGREIKKVAAMNKRYVSKLSSAYGNLVLRKVTLEVELKDLLNRVTPKHPDVKLKRDELLALERQIKSALQWP